MIDTKILKKLPAVFFALLLILPCFACFAYAEGDVISVGKSYTVSSESPIDNAYPSLADETPDGRLTDGKNGGTQTYNDGKYVRFYRGTYKDIVIDLGGEYAVEGAAVSHYQNAAAGVYAIREVYVYASLDGNDYMCIAENVNDDRIKVSAQDGRVVVNADCDGAFKARYVKIRFSCDVFAYVDEISVKGTSDTAHAKDIVPDAVSENKGFAGSVDGVNHICLMYTGEYAYGSPTTSGRITAEQLLPYFAYVDNDGKATDTMFEGMLFLPYQPAAKSNDTTAEYGFGKQSGWQSFLNCVMGGEEYNLSALNKVVGDNKEAIGLTLDYRYPVYIAVPYIHPSDSVFGVIDGQTVTPNTLESRQKIVKWYVDSVIKAFGESNFDHLKLCGFYWYSEAVQYSYGKDENNFIKHFTSYVYSLGMSSLWIPYYCSAGYVSANELGFTAAVLQSGYAFDHSTSETGDSLPATCDDAMSMADKYGLGAEIEVSSLDSDMYDRYYKYLQAAYAGGYMQDGLFMYYQGGGPGVYYSASAGTANSSQRKGYDLTYQFIHGTFTSAAPVIAEGQKLMIGKGGFVTCRIDISDSDSSSSQLKTLKKPECEDITVAVEGDGYTVINAKKSDFVGETGFYLTVTDGFNVSETVYITLNVVEDCFTADRIDGKLKSDFGVLYTYDADGDNTTGTNEDAFEVVIDSQGVITSVGGYNGTVPEGGYIVAASGTKQEYLKSHCSVGGKAVVDPVTGCILFESDGTADVSSDVSGDESVPASTDDGDSAVLVIVIVIAALAVIAVSVLLIVKKRKK